MDHIYIFVIGGVAALLIILLIVVNIFLIRWVCRRKKEKRMQGLSNSERPQQRPVNLVNPTRRGAQANNEVKYVTQATMNKNKSTSKGKTKKKKSYENSDSEVFGCCGDIPALPEEYTFHSLQRDHRPKRFEEDEPTNEYGHIHLGIEDGNKEYDSVRFINKKAVCEADSTYACVDKCKREKIDSTYNHTSERRDVDTVDDSSIELPQRGYLGQSCQNTTETGYELSKNVSIEQLQNLPNDRGGREKEYVTEESTSENPLERKQDCSSETEDEHIQSKYSCLNDVTSAKEISRTLVRKSAGTQVESVDFSCSPIEDKC